MKSCSRGRSLLLIFSYQIHDIKLKFGLVPLIESLKLNLNGTFIGGVMHLPSYIC